MTQFANHDLEGTYEWTSPAGDHVALPARFLNALVAIHDVFPGCEARFYHIAGQPEWRLVRPNKTGREAEEMT